MFKKILIILVWLAIGIIVVWAGGYLALKNKKTTANISTSLDEFAKCLTDNGVKIYGADWCPHCQNQKKLFGESFKFINYTECADPANPRKQQQACTDANITGYPTWVFPSGERIEGEASFKDLSKKTSCSYLR